MTPNLETTIDTVDQIVKDTDKALGGVISDTTANSDGRGQRKLEHNSERAQTHTRVRY